ncbi:MAG: Gfo/Idh/MocA family oxidoreductase [Mariniblastus sp.]|nr:Gfo/Idh/MocA family oxidoreductase [Mariniblastus sp.]
MQICMLGSGFNADFYATALHRHRSRDRVTRVYSRTPESAERFAKKWDIPFFTSDLEQAVNDPDVDVVIVSLPNYQHEMAVMAAVKAGKPVLCTKPLGCNAAEALRMLEAVESAGLFHGYLEDLVYTPKTLKAVHSVQGGAIGDVLWVRSRETHPGPHSDWFWKKEFSGGGALIDMGCHCVEIARNFIGKEIRPVEVVCWADTQVHPIETEDHAIGLVRYDNGAIGQFEVSWSFRGGLDLRDEVAGTEGTIFLNHWLRTGFEIYSAGGQQDYVAEKSESSQGWLFPVGDEPAALGYSDMFAEMLSALEEQREPMETFYDGLIVNCVMDAAYQSIRTKQWEPIELPVWRGKESSRSISPVREFDEEHDLIKREHLPNGTTKVILRHKTTGEITQRLDGPQ